MLSEPDFRKKIQDAFDRIDGALESLDPDLVECEQAQGAMSITFADRSRCILSAQPSVRQLWLALAAIGTAHHFNFDGERWVNDKGKGLELLSYLGEFLSKKAGKTIQL